MKYWCNTKQKERTVGRSGGTSTRSMSSLVEAAIYFHFNFINKTEIWRMRARTNLIHLLGILLAVRSDEPTESVFFYFLVLVYGLSIARVPSCVSWGFSSLLSVFRRHGLFLFSDNLQRVSQACSSTSLLNVKFFFGLSPWTSFPSENRSLVLFPATTLGEPTYRLLPGNRFQSKRRLTALPGLRDLS